MSGINLCLRWGPAGSFGKGYKTRIEGQYYVAKNFGNPESTIGAMGVLQRPECELMALKQTAMHNALAASGQRF